jgi:hypothetical protein
LQAGISNLLRDIISSFFLLPVQMRKEGQQKQKGAFWYSSPDRWRAALPLVVTSVTMELLNASAIIGRRRVFFAFLHIFL